MNLFLTRKKREKLLKSSIQINSFIFLCRRKKLIWKIFSVCFLGKLLVFLTHMENLMKIVFQNYGFLYWHWFWVQSETFY